MSGTYNIVIFNNEDLDRVITWSTSSLPVSKGGIPVDLTGYTASMSINSVTNFITTTTSANGLITLGGIAGTVKVYIPKTASAQFVDSAPFYRLFVTAPSGETSCLLDGTFQVLP